MAQISLVCPQFLREVSGLWKSQVSAAGPPPGLLSLPAHQQEAVCWPALLLPA